MINPLMKNQERTTSHIGIVKEGESELITFVDGRWKSAQLPTSSEFRTRELLEITCEFMLKNILL